MIIIMIIIIMIFVIVVVVNIIIVSIKTIISMCSFFLSTYFLCLDIYLHLAHLCLYLHELLKFAYLVSHWLWRLPFTLYTCSLSLYEPYWRGYCVSSSIFFYTSHTYNFYKMIKSLGLNNGKRKLWSVNDNASNIKVAIRESEHLCGYFCAIHSMQLGKGWKKPRKLSTFCG